MKILAIETSCDETSIAIADFKGSPKKGVFLNALSHIVSSQVKIHAKFGGVVPNLAKREHQKNLAPIFLRAIKEAGLLKNHKSQNTNHKQNTKRKTQKIEKIFEREPELLKQFKKHILFIKPPKIDAVAVTQGPGLAPALWVGVNFAKALSLLWNKPLIPVNHMEGHVYSALLRSKNKKLQAINYKLQAIEFPALALLVSGGHTELALMRGHHKYKIIGETLDDAAGEAFDKVARILGLSYPGGPYISREAQKLQATSYKLQAKLPRPMLNSNGFNLSFSGLKTAVLYLVRDLRKDGVSIKKTTPAIAKEFQDAVVEVLVKKTIRAAKEYKVKTILLGGGVAANKELQFKLKVAIRTHIPHSTFHIPHSTLTGDNALMIATAAFMTGKKIAPNKVAAQANLKLGDK